MKHKEYQQKRASLDDAYLLGDISLSDYARDSINLDPWMMGKDHIVQAARHFTINSLGVAEGVMGLFDGSDPESDVGSTMEIARWLGWQIILVVSCQNIFDLKLKSYRNLLQHKNI